LIANGSLLVHIRNSPYLEKFLSQSGSTDNSWKGTLMSKALRLFAILAAGLFLSSCASVQLRPLSSGETRLTYMEMPEIVREDLPYEVILSVAAEEKPLIKKICFRWLTEEISSGSPSLYCYTTGVDFAKGPSCATWVAQNVSVGSDSFCAGPEDIRSDIPGKLIVKIRPTKLNTTYNKLEGQAEYLSDGRLKLTNKISTKIIVER